ncbi:MAG: TetR/AcrR family transcriptional regulator [Myxococcota bacterium]
MRKQRPRGSTTREAVVNAALRVADRNGLDALTIRGVAEEVAAPPMSLYVHFANKNQLLDLMYAEVSRRMYEDEGHPTWQTELYRLCLRVRALLTEHPNWAALLARPAPAMPVPMRERVLALMVADGMSESQAFKALSGIVLTAIGLVLAELTMRSPDGKSTLEDRFERMKELLDQLPETEQTQTRTAMNALSHFSLGDTFAFTVGALITGVARTRGDTPDPSA